MISLELLTILFCTLYLNEANGRKELFNLEYNISWPKALDVSPRKDRGALKHILREGAGDRNPVFGDFVWFHYVGTLANGTKFDSSHDRGAMFTFQLGYSEVIKVYEHAVPTMKKGELAMFRAEPDYAYGERGTGSTIPGNAVLLFKVEIVDFRTCENLHKDCQSKADSGECVRNQIWMRDNCFKSCSTCKPPACVTSDNECDIWAVEGECVKNPNFMFKHCATECDNCSVKMPDNVHPITDDPTDDIIHSETITTCEGDTLSIFCPNQYELHMDSITYGRSDQDTCAVDTSIVEMCTGADTDTIVRDLCDGQAMCNILVNAQTLGKNCMNYHRGYLEVTYRCKPKLFEGIVCDESQLILSCPLKNDSIEIVSSFYGRNDKTTCGFEEHYNTECSKDYAVDMLALLCNGKNTCELYPWPKLFGSDPCEGTTKYLQVTFLCGDCLKTENPEKCRFADVCDNVYENSDSCEYWSSIGECGSNAKYMSEGCPQSCNTCFQVANIQDDASPKLDGIQEIVCEGFSKEISCPDDNHYLFINQVFYGRTNLEICPHSTATDLDTPCDVMQKGALERMQQLCNGRKNCHFSANSVIWGDTCPGVFKYGEISYTCQGCGNVYDDKQCENMEKKGRCTSDPKFMYDNCFEASTKCGQKDCKNFHDETHYIKTCDYWALTGLCDSDSDWMYLHCQQSCGLCNQPILAITDESSYDQMYEENIVCNLTDIKISCPSSYYILIMEASYGRKDSITCPEAAATDLSTDLTCDIAGIDEFMKQSCNGLESCSFTLDAIQDSCPEVAKYLSYTYRCKPQRFEVLQCAAYYINPPNRLELLCPENTVINITKAFYGRKNNYTCGPEPQWKYDCRSSTSFKRISSHCNGREKCYFYLSDDMLGDPCGGGMKSYLNVSYQCSACQNDHVNNTACRQMQRQDKCVANANWMTANCRLSCWNCSYVDTCNNDHADSSKCDEWAANGQCRLNPAYMTQNCRKSCNQCPGLWQGVSDIAERVALPMCEKGIEHLICPSGYHLKIEAVYYGREDHLTCPHANIFTTDCKTPENALSIVQGVCNGRSDCYFEARSDSLGDSCPDTYKAAGVRYACQSCTNSYNDAKCAEWKQLNQCVENYAWMFSHCFKTCSDCHKKACTNYHDEVFATASCDYWAMRGECKKDATWMEENCALACGLCSTVRNKFAKLPAYSFSKNIIACGKEKMKLTCPNSYHITITSALYGRQDSETCVTETMDFSMCEAHNVERAVRNYCSGYKGCTLWANNATFGEECAEESSYLNVTYECNIADYEGEVCEGNSITLSCPYPYVIHIIDAMYGRDDNVTCGGHSLYTAPCTNSNASKNIEILCNNKHNCSMFAQTKMFGEDPCPGQHKYTKFTYVCAECLNDADTCSDVITADKCSSDPVQMASSCRETCWHCDYTDKCVNLHNNDTECEDWASKALCFTNAEWMKDKCRRSCNLCHGLKEGFLDIKAKDIENPAVCEGDFTILSCEENYGIRIRDIFYGRNDSETCIDESMYNTECYTQDGALEKARIICNGRQKCYVEAISENWGDNCPDTSKYMTVKYECQACNNVYSDSECARLAALDMCTTKFNWMMDNCYRACTRCNVRGCDNKFNTISSPKSCDSWGIQGDCIHNPDWMLQKCPASCDMCDNPSVDIRFSIDTEYDMKGVSPNSCQGGMYSLICSDGYQIEIISAQFGRWTTEEICTTNVPSNLVTNKTCTVEGVFDRMIKKCQGEQVCPLMINSNDLGEGCDDVYKYLDLTFTCKAPLYQGLMCHDIDETPILTLECPYPEDVIHVTAVFYGRSEIDVCEHINGTDTTCSSSIAMQRVVDLCNGKKSCGVGLHENLLGDPCPGINKYLQVDYLCAECGNKANVVECQNNILPRGGCNGLLDWTTAYCRRECWNCFTTDTCENQLNDNKCDFWASIGECLVNESFMSHNCTRSCNLCAKFWQGEPDKIDPVMEDLCEHDVRHIDCHSNPNYYLRIDEVFYGRIYNDTCLNRGPIRNLSCNTPPDALGKVQSVCNGKKECYFEAESSVLGDLCSNTYKSASVKYTCQDCSDAYITSECVRKRDEGRCISEYDWMMDNCFKTCSRCSDIGFINHNIESSALGCNNQVVYMACPEDYSLTIIEVVYGRQSMTVCPYKLEEELTETKMCNSPLAKKKVVSLCQGKSWCRVPVNNRTFRDPCPDVEKYLKVTYVCRANRKDVLECGDNLSIQCQKPGIIQILSAFYGRDNNSTCTQTSGAQDKICSVNSSTEVVASLCNARDTCHIDVTNSQFQSESCSGISKYLQVSYLCGKCIGEWGDDKYCHNKAKNGHCAAQPSWMKTTCRKPCWGCDPLG